MGFTFRVGAAGWFDLVDKLFQGVTAISRGQVGEAVKDGVKIQWHYDAISEQLEVQCLRAPFWVDSARINHDLRREIESTLDYDRAA